MLKDLCDGKWETKKKKREGENRGGSLEGGEHWMKPGLGRLVGEGRFGNRRSVEKSKKKEIDRGRQ